MSAASSTCFCSSPRSSKLMLRGARVAPAPPPAGTELHVTPVVAFDADTPPQSPAAADAPAGSPNQSAASELGRLRSLRSPAITARERLRILRSIPGPRTHDTRPPRLPSEDRRLRQPLPRYGLVLRHDVIRVTSINIVEIERMEPRLELPAGTFCCCGYMAKLTCDEHGNGGCCHRAWVRVAITIASILDRLMLCAVAHGSDTARELNSQWLIARAWRELTPSLAAALAVIAIFIVAANSALCGCAIH